MRQFIILMLFVFSSIYGFAQYKKASYTDTKYNSSFTRFLSFTEDRLLDDLSDRLPITSCVSQLLTIEFNVDTNGNIVNLDFGKMLSTEMQIYKFPGQYLDSLKMGYDSILRKTNGHWVPASKDGKSCISNRMVIFLNFNYFGGCKHEGRNFSAKDNINPALLNNLEFCYYTFFDGLYSTSKM